MKISISASLYKLAKLFKKKHAKLFLIGGCVRNAIIGIPCFDVDICGWLKLDEVEELLKDTEFSLNIKNETLGTADITCENSSWEYTVLRTEKYPQGGAHKPESVEFVKSVEEDAFRRDFTMNSIYVDIIKGEFIDPFLGEMDIKRRQVCAVADPNEVFSHDGLRILRMIRFACELNFSIESKTFGAAFNHRANLADISAERKRNELLALLKCTEKYKDHTKSDAFLRGLHKYNKLGLWKFFSLPIQKVKFSLVKKADVESRFLALVIDILHEINPRDKFAFLSHFLGSDGLGFTNEEVDEMTNVVLGYLDAIEVLNNKDYFFKYFNYFSKIAPLIKKKSTKIYKKYNFFYKYLINNKIAIQVKDLEIKGSDIKKIYPNIPQRRYSYILNELLSKVFDGAVENTKQRLIEEVANYDY